LIFGSTSSGYLLVTDTKGNHKFVSAVTQLEQQMTFFFGSEMYPPYLVLINVLPISGVVFLAVLCHGVEHNIVCSSDQKRANSNYLEFMMSRFEKIFSLFSLLYFITMAGVLFAIPAARTLQLFLPLAFVGVTLNVGLLFIVFRDIFSRTFYPESRRYLWVFIIFLFLPAVVIYLPMHGFRPK